VQDDLAKVLDTGVFAWNSWRREHPEIRPDLRGVTLAGRDLGGLDLSKADLVEANLQSANLYGANLTEANLYRANLAGVTLLEASLNSANLHETDFTGAMLDQAEFGHAYLSGATLQRASLRNAFLDNAQLGATESGLPGANLTGADLGGARLRNANLTGANLHGADLTDADLFWANLSRSDLTGANLSRANLQLALLIETNLEGANLTDCHVFGLSAWNVRLDHAVQHDLVISGPADPPITCDNLEIAQFLYLLLNNRKIRDVIDTITSKVVLILGRFSEERKAVLDALRSELRQRDYLPVLFDFDQPSSRDITETVSTIAHLSRFLIADITDARSIPQELMAIVPDLPSVPVQPLLLGSAQEYAMFGFFRRFPWVLEPFVYSDVATLLAALSDKVIAPAEQKVREQQRIAPGE
jgi:uncharacterized protein YjbI with pentapeptide repeats